MREQGKIKWFDLHKGYGFIVPNSGHPDVFLHITQCQECDCMPQPGKSVAFEAMPTRLGMKATWVGEVKNEY